jgi:nicotinamidase-related amidase
MAKDRLALTCRYLKERARSGQIGALSVDAIDKLEAYAKRHDRIRGGQALSLNWSWYNKRPAEEVRHAIRGYLLASIYNGDLNADQAADEAKRVKEIGLAELLRTIGTKLTDFLGEADPINTRSVLYKPGAKGAGKVLAKPVCERRIFPVEDEMETLMLSDPTIAVVIIDMQSGGDVGQNRMYAGKTILQHQQAVLRTAARLRMIIYDIVIDDRDANVLGHQHGTLASLSPEDKDAVLARQRRDSYADEARTSTLAVLRDLYRPGAQVRHIPKPTYPTFVGTLFAEHLQADGVRTVAVMGYDANVCVKATVFGSPLEEQVDIDGPAPTPDAILAVMKKNPKLTPREAQLKAAAKTKTVVRPYVQGLLDRNISVLTSRAVLASSGRLLEPEWSVLAGLN